MYLSDFRAFFVACQFSTDIFPALSSFPSKLAKISRPSNPNPCPWKVLFSFGLTVHWTKNHGRGALKSIKDIANQTVKEFSGNLANLASALRPS